jgi:hypothetical protein
MTDTSFQYEAHTEALDSFKEIVLKDVRNESNEEDRKYLHENIDYWLYSLQITRRDVEFQLSSHRSKERIMFHKMKLNETKTDDMIEEIKKSDKWRMGAIRFLAAIEKRMLYVKVLQKGNITTEG